MTDPQGESIRFAEVHGVNHLALHGVVDLFVAAELRELALQCTKSGRAMVVDCRCLERIDGSVLQLMLAIERENRDQAADFSLLGVPDNVLRYLRLAGAERLLGAVRPAREGSSSVPGDASVAAPIDLDGFNPGKDEQRE